MDFAQRLKILMDETGTSMYRLGKFLNVHQTTIKNWLTKSTSPRQEEIVKISNFFGVTVDYLLTGEQKEKAPSSEAEGLSKKQKYLIDAISRMSDEQAQAVLATVEQMTKEK